MRRLFGVLLLGAALLVGCGDNGDDLDVATDDVGVASDFDRLDANGDSYLDVDEVAEAADVAGVFETWDADSDSELDRDEISGNAFRLWDADGNGAITQSEWENATKLWYPADRRPTVFSDWDGDGDSELDTDEVAERLDISAPGESWGEPMDEETFRKAYFELYDADDDGRVTEVEWNGGKATLGTPAE